MTIELLGPTRVSGGDGTLSPRDRVVLSTLCVLPGEAVPAEVIADALWGGEPPKTWTKVVQGSVVRLRKALGTAAIVTDDAGYRLALPAGEIDTVEFERLVARGREFMAVHEPARAVVLFGQALSLWRGAPFVELDGWDPARSEAARLMDVRRSVEEELVQARLDMGLEVQAASDAQVLVAREPFRERRWGLLALALYRTGRQREALDVLRRARATLAEELGIDPGPELGALETRMLQQDPALLQVRAGAAASSSTCPYRGLRSYDVGDADFFHGRSDVASEAARRLGEFPLLIVVGPSGSGKSSLVRAGLVPALADGRSPGRGRVAVMVPGPDPVLSLAVAAAASAPDGLLVVDQLEELFAPGSLDSAAPFLDRLSELAESGRQVVATVRADHLGGLAVSPRFSRAAEHALLLLTPLSEQQLRRVIEEPARQVGLVLEPGLVDLLVRDVAGEAGGLPLLSHALAETWEHREGTVLTVDGYRASGGIREAVAQSAERLYDSLDRGDRATLRSVLLRLVVATATGEPMAARVPTRVFAGTPDAPRVLDLLVRARLVTAADESVTLAHESLVRAWPRLRGWLDEDVEGQRVLAHLQATADDWLTEGRAEDELYRGARLAAALEWQERVQPVLSSAEHQFLAASVDREHAEQARLARELAVEARRNRQLRVALVGVVAVLALALAAGGLAVVNARRADSAALDADARRLAAQSYAASDSATAQLLAAAAYRLRDTIDTRSALLGALQRDDAVLYQVPTRFRDAWVGAPADGSRLLIMDNFHQVTAFDPATRALHQLYRAPVGVMADISPDGRWLVGCSPDDEHAVTGPPQVVVLDASTGVVARTLPTSPPELPGGLSCGGFTGDGRFLVVAESLGYDQVGDVVDVYDAHDWTAPPRTWRPGSPISALAVGTARFATRSADGEVTTVSVADLTEVSRAIRPELSCADVCPLALSRDDRDVALSDSGGHTPVQLMADRLDGRSSAAEGLGAEVARLAYSPDGRRLAAFGADGGMLLQAAAASAGEVPLSVLRRAGDGSGTRSVVWTGQRQQTRLYSVGMGGRLVAWNLSAAPRAVRIEGAAPLGFAFARQAGDRLVGITPDAVSAYRFDMATREGQWWSMPRAAGDPDQSSWSADGSRVALTFRDNPHELWRYVVLDMATGEPVFSTTIPQTPEQLAHPDDFPAWATISDDGERMVVPRSRDRLSIFDVASGQEIREFAVGLRSPQDDGLWLTPLLLGDDGTLLLQVHSPVPTDPGVVPGSRFPWRDPVPRELLVADQEGHVWGRTLLASAQGVEQAVLSPDRNRLAVSAFDGTIQVFDARSLAAISPPVRAHGGWVMSLSWSPDGSMLLSSGTDGVLALWDGESLNRIGPAALLGGSGRNGSTAWFTPDGGILGVVQGLDAARGQPSWFTMDGQADRWLTEDCDLAGRDMSAEEWSQYVGARDRRPVCTAS